MEVETICLTGTVFDKYGPGVATSAPPTQPRRGNGKEGKVIIVVLWFIVVITENVSLRFHPEKRCECRTLSGIYMYMV